MKFHVFLVKADKGIIALKAGFMLYAKDYLVTHFDKDIHHQPMALVFCSDELPVDGDKVYVPFNNSIWEFKKSPCPMPYWGNPNSCWKITHCSNPIKGVGYLSDKDIHHWMNLKEPAIIEAETEDLIDEESGDIVSCIIYPI